MDNPSEQKDPLPPNLLPYKHKITTSIDCTVKVLEQGGIVLLPSDTIPGISCDASNEKAVLKVINLKKRQKVNEGFIVLISNESMASWYTRSFNPEIYRTIKESFQEIPVTIIWENGRNVALSVLGPDGSIAIRIVNLPYIHKIVEKLGRGIISTSANISGEKYPASMEEVSPPILENVDLIFYSKEISFYKSPSKIVKVTEGSNFVVIR